MNLNGLFEVISQTIKDSFDKYKEDLPADKTYIGTVTEVLGNKKYKIQYNDANRQFTTINDIPLAVGDKVHIVYPLGSNKDMYMTEDMAAASSGTPISGVKTVDGQTGDIDLTNKYASKLTEHNHSNKSLLDIITPILTDNWNTAYTHSDSTHAPSNAERNVITGIQKNGTDLSIDSSSRKVNLIIPTNVSELTNDSGYKTTDNNTTYNLTKSGSTITLTGSDGTTTSVADSNTTYSHATTSSSGLMSPTDKSKLDTIESGAQVNIEINEQAPTYTPTNSLSTLVSGEKILVSFGKISKAISDLITHLADSVVHITSTERTLWNKVSDKVDIVSGKQLSTNDFSNDEKIKLTGIEEGANKYTHPSYTAKTTGLYKVTVDGTGHVSAAAAVSKSDITALGIPESNTDTKVAQLISMTTEFRPLALGGTSSALIPPVFSVDTKEIYVAPNLYAKPSTGELYATGGFKGNADTATKATQDSAGQQINSTYLKALSISGKTLTYTKGDDSSGTLTTQDTTYSTATTSIAGLMSSTDKTKLDNIAAGANAYTHPSYTAKAAGLYKVTVDSTGHVSSTAVVEKSDITGLGIPSADTHYISKNVVGGTTSTTNTTTALANGNVYMNSVENGSVTSSHKISGSGATTVTTDASGNIVIASTDTNTNTTYTAGTGLSLNGTTFNHSNSILAGTVGDASSRTLTYEAPFNIPSITYDAQGHVTKAGSYTLFLPAPPTSVTGSSGSCTGNAATATKATEDSAGQQINLTYIKGLSVSGKTITITKGNNTTSTITTQDTVYTLPTATSSVLGGVKTGSNITNSSGTISITKENIISALGYTPVTAASATIIGSEPSNPSNGIIWIEN